MSNFPFRPKRKKIDGRLFEYEKKHRRWKPQCAKCGKFKYDKSFEITTESPKTLGQVCVMCRLDEKRQSVTATRGPKQRKICQHCQASFHTVFKELVECSRCFQKRNSTAPLDRAYALLFPHLRHYGTITGLDIFAKPDKYPGPTYYHLEKDDRERALNLAKYIVATETGDPKWKNDLGSDPQEIKDRLLFDRLTKQEKAS